MDIMNGKKLMPVKLFFVHHSPSNMDPELSPIIFIHGMGATNRSWNKVKHKISDKTKRKVYAIDLRNHGHSEYSGDIALNYLVADVENFMETENIPKAVLVGHSLGGRVAASLTLKRPEIVEKLVIEETALKDTDEEIRAYKKFIGYAKTMQQAVQFLPRSLTIVEAQKQLHGYLSAFWPQFLKNTSASNIFVTIPLRKAKSGEFIWDFNIDALMKMEKDFTTVQIDLSNKPVYHGDFLLLGGEKSEFLKKADVEVYMKHFPNCQAQFFADGIHALHVEFPEKYAKVVSEFIGE